MSSGKCSGAFTRQKSLVRTQYRPPYQWLSETWGIDGPSPGVPVASRAAEAQGRRRSKRRTSVGGKLIASLKDPDGNVIGLLQSA